MNGMLARSLSLVLGSLAAAGVWAQDADWHGAAPTAASSGAMLGKPMALGDTAAPAGFAPAALLGRPQASDAGSPAVTDRNVQPASFSDSMFAPPRVVARAKGLEAAQQMPVGPAGEPKTIKFTDGSWEPPPPTMKVPGPEVIPAPPTPMPTPMPTPVPGSYFCDKPGCCDAPAPSACCDPCNPCCELAERCCGCNPCCTPTFWARIEYLNWSVRDSHYPALLTTSPQASLGVIGRDGTTTIFGGDNFDHGDFHGGRLTLGGWFDCEHLFGLEGSIFVLGERSSHFAQSSPGDPLLARPITNAVTGAPDSELVAARPPNSPFNTAGTISIDSSVELWGGEINGLFNLWDTHFNPFACCCWGCGCGCGDCCYHLDLLAGARYLHLRERLFITEDLVVTNATTGAGVATDNISDRFYTGNDFGGAQIGLRQTFDWRRWELGLSTKVAFGVNHETIDINGQNIVTLAGGTPNVFGSGLLAAPTNAGHYTRDRFAVAPEAGVTLSYEICDHWRIIGGYNFLYISQVARPEGQIDTVVNKNQVANMGTNGGPLRPAFNPRDTSFWAQGGTIGVEFRY